MHIIQLILLFFLIIQLILFFLITVLFKQCEQLSFKMLFQLKKLHVYNFHRKKFIYYI